jgi:transposase
MTNRTFKVGESREQPSLLPPRIEDYVGPDNPVRAIEGFVCALDLAKLGFRHADRGAEAMGQPPYDPADLLKLYLYGYINQVRSSRRLEREACRNLELIWLLKNLRPGYRTIANFRKENWKALKAANRRFVLLARELGLSAEPLSQSTARSSMAMPARRASSRARGSPNRSRSWTRRSRLTAILLKTMMRRKPSSQGTTATMMAAAEMAPILARRSRR